MRVDLPSVAVVPPWITDPEPDTWVPLWVAAHLYFRKSTEWVWHMVKNGTLEEFGFKVFRHGKFWHVKLPVAIPPETYLKHRAIRKSVSDGLS